MTLHSNFARRKARGGRGLLPPNPKWWGVEHNALDLRDDLDLPPDAQLDVEAAFDLLPNALLLPHGDLLAANRYLSHFRGPRSGAWSGMVVTLEDGFEIVVYNDSHPATRTRATTMEEFFHIHLCHPRSKLRCYTPDGGHRTYDAVVEQEAYGCGAAALVPYAGLRSLIASGCGVPEIARHFLVSEDLVAYRCNVTRSKRRRA